MLTISVLNYRNWQATADCVADIGLACKDVEHRILVRDNSEVPETGRLQSALPHPQSDVLYFESPDNPGFGRGHNRNFHAVRHVAGDLFLILNNDVRISDPAAITSMMQACGPKHIVSCVIQNAVQGDVWFSGVAINRVTGDLVGNRKSFKGPSRSTAFVSGCCLLIHSEFYQSLGGFDERFFMYAEDLDLCLRARALGSEAVVVNHRILHQVGSGEKGLYSDLYLYENTKNRMLCLRRHRLGTAPVSIIYFVVKYGVCRSIQLAAHSQAPLRQIRAAWRGLWDGIVQTKVCQVQYSDVQI